jgi:hypothetical protein
LHTKLHVAGSLTDPKTVERVSSLDLPRRRQARQEGLEVVA